MPEPKPVCSFAEMKTCFPDKKDLFLEFHDVDDDHDYTVKCDCLQNCLDSNVIVEKFQHLQGTRLLLGSIGGLMIMKKYPLIRFQREVIFTLTDFFGEQEILETFMMIRCSHRVVRCHSLVCSVDRRNCRVLPWLFASGIDRGFVLLYSPSALVCAWKAVTK